LLILYVWDYNFWNENHVVEPNLEGNVDVEGLNVEVEENPYLEGNGVEEGEEVIKEGPFSLIPH
jgi:hypothetical protein